ncbi:unnamed protein product [Paramecium pentaurelia]|uniref:Protein kinase domain-containing protein n=1 Tax=Paramecium pentaurelia TaxID=43138 RepID=A0A8S1VGV8_9CILI|nr:unnamed protein product [Paramecium pentaurelia]
MGNCFLQEEEKNQKSSIKKVDSFLAQQIEKRNEKSKVTLKDFLSQGEIGRGKFGKVLRVKMKGKDNREYAMKVIKKADILKYGLVEHTMLEKNVLGASKNPFVVKLKYSFQTEQKLYLVMEFIKGGQLAKVLRKRQQGRFTEEQTKFCAAEIILGLEYMHNILRVIYRDLKPENVMVTEEGHLKLADFGLSKQYENEEAKFFTLAGTPEYLAPEILFNQGHNHMVDFWCLGILIYEMLVGYTPFCDTSGNHKSIENNIKNGQITYPNFMSDQSKDIVDRLLNKDPTQRLGSKNIQEIKDHNFFCDINWTQLYNLDIPSPILENTHVYPQVKKDQFGKRIYETPSSHFIETNGDFNGFSAAQE